MDGRGVGFYFSAKRKPNRRFQRRYNTEYILLPRPRLECSEIGTKDSMESQLGGEGGTFSPILLQPLCHLGYCIVL